MKPKTKQKSIKGNSIKAISRDFSNSISYKDHKIKFITKYCVGKDVLDIGCVHHDPENYKSKYWLHKAIREVARDVTGIDLYKDGVEYLRQRGFNIEVSDAQCFDLNKKFDVIVAADLIEHLEDFGGFLESCKKHMRKDSRLILSTPNPWYWRNFVKAGLSKEVSNNPEHTCWLCVRTLRQLLERHELVIGEIAFGSRYIRDRIIPLPTGWKHTSFHVEVFHKSMVRDSAES